MQSGRPGNETTNENCCCPSACSKFCKKICSIICSPIGVCCLILSYIALGAALFTFVEGSYEKKKVAEVTKYRKETVSKLWDITMTLNILYKENWTHLVSREMFVFQKNIMVAMNNGYEGRELKGRRQWSFPSAFLYALTIITTVGKVR